MPFGNCNGCYSIHNYEAAQKHWNREPEPGRPGSALRERWASARPLDDARKWHYRIEHHTYPERVDYKGLPIPAQDYFDVCLYHTCMVRYHRPEADGTRRVDYTNHGSALSHQFMWRMGYGAQLKLGETVVPVAYKQLGTTIWTDAAGALIKGKSHHEPVYRRVSSPEQKAWRKQLKESTRNLATLFEMGMYLPEPGGSKWGRHDGEPFKGVNIQWDTKQELRYFDGELTESTTHATVDALRDVWVACLQFLVDKRDYGANNASRYNYRRKLVPPYKAPTPQEVTKSWFRKIEDLCCRERAADERIPDWPTAEQLPKKYYY